LVTRDARIDFARHFYWATLDAARCIEKDRYLYQRMKCLFRHELATVTILCILSIFLFPVATGPYSAVHGPVTALLAFRAALKIRFAMTLAAFGALLFLLEIGSRSLRIYLPCSTQVTPLGDAFSLRC
jgi:hypothetical protein